MLNCSAVRNHTDGALGHFKLVVYMLVFAVGLVFNITALCIFCRVRRWTATHIYMLNLLVADLLVIVFLPFRLLDTFCVLEKTKLCTFLLCTHFSNMYSSILTITAISVHRFIAVRFPFLAKIEAAKRKMTAVSVCILIWVIITVVSVTFHENLHPEHLETCYNLQLQRKLDWTFFLVLEIAGYLVPITIVVFCSTQTIYILVKSMQRVDGSNKQERKTIVAVISANMFTFSVCFTPVHIGLLLQYLSAEQSNNTLYVFLNVAEWIAITNCCLDSIGYYFLLKSVAKRRCLTQKHNVTL